MRSRKLLVIAVLVFSAVPAFPQTPAEILEEAALFGNFSSLTATLEMEIHDRGTKTRTLELYLENTEERYRALMQVIEPGFLSEMKFLTDTSGGETRQWLSTSRGVRRLSETSGEERIFDSDFTAEDLSGYRAEDYELRLLHDERIGGEEAHVLEARALAGNAGYHRRVLYVSKDRDLLLRADYISEQGELVKQFELLEAGRQNGSYLPQRAVMRTLSLGTQTFLRVREVETDASIPSRLFNRGNL